MLGFASVLRVARARDLSAVVSSRLRFIRNLPIPVPGYINRTFSDCLTRFRLGVVAFCVFVDRLSVDPVGDALTKSIDLTVLRRGMHRFLFKQLVKRADPVDTTICYIENTWADETPLDVVCEIAESVGTSPIEHMYGLAGDGMCRKIVVARNGRGELLGALCQVVCSTFEVLITHSVCPPEVFQEFLMRLSMKWPKTQLYSFASKEMMGALGVFEAIIPKSIPNCLHKPNAECYCVPGMDFPPAPCPFLEEVY